MSDNLPVKKENFLAEVEVMDLTSIKDKAFVVAIATGDPEGVKFLCSTPHGPYTFTEMVQEVGDMWVQHQHHAKVIILDKDSTKRVQMLDANTVDYIECHSTDIITEEMLGGAFDNKEFTCRAGLVHDENGTDPRAKKVESDAVKSDTST
jgi:hypothetical protein